MADEMLTTQPSMEMLRYKEELAAKMGLPSPYGMQILKQVCQDMVDSGMVPKHFANNPMAVFGAAMRGREMGLQPMESVMETFWAAPGGRLGLYAAKMLDLLHRGGVKSRFLKEDAEGCEIEFTPPNDHPPYLAKFYAAEAQAAGLVKQDSNWTKWRSDMNRARAISRGWRALAGTYKGAAANLYSKEEMIDTGMVDEETGSSAGEASQSDRRRAEVLTARESPLGDYKVALKSQVGTEPEVKPKTTFNGLTEVDPADLIKSAPVQRDMATIREVYKKDFAENPENISAPAPAPADDVVYQIYARLKLGGGGVRPIPCGAEPEFSNLATAAVRAQDLATANGEDYMLMRVNKTTGERTDDVILHAPPKVTPPPKATPAEAKADADTRDASNQRITALAAQLNMPKADLVKIVGQLASGYLAIPLGQVKGKATPSQILTCMDLLDALVKHDVAELTKTPFEAGRRRREREEAVQRYLEEVWPMHPDLIAMGVRLSRWLNHTPANFQTWMSSPVIGLNTMPTDPIEEGDVREPDSQARAFMRLALRNVKNASRLLKSCRDHHLSIAFALDHIEKQALYEPVDTASEDRLELAIDSYLDAIEAEAKRVIADEKTQAMAAAGSSQSEDAGLFTEFTE